MRHLRAVLGLFIIPLALMAMPGEVEAQCWHCSGLSCIYGSSPGGADPCGYFEVCDPFNPEDCWWNCGGRGGPCGGVEAVALTGQIVETGAAEPSAPSDLVFDPVAGVHRARCNGAIVFIPTALELERRSPAAPARSERIVLR